jgi:hypothetical protein
MATNFNKLIKKGDSSDYISQKKNKQYLMNSLNQQLLLI